jgi:hypothetical protein
MANKKFTKEEMNHLRANNMGNFLLLLYILYKFLELFYLAIL